MKHIDVTGSAAVTRWGEQPPQEDFGEALLDDTAATPYTINEELNFKIALWQGDITKLHVDAIINCTNEDLNERAGVSGQIFAAAGPQMEEACAKLGGCPPGDAKATRGFRLPAKHVIHAVPPAWVDGGLGDSALEALYTKARNRKLDQRPHHNGRVLHPTGSLVPAARMHRQRHTPPTTSRARWKRPPRVAFPWAGPRRGGPAQLCDGGGCADQDQGRAA